MDHALVVAGYSVRKWIGARCAILPGLFPEDYRREFAACHVNERDFSDVIHDDLAAVRRQVGHGDGRALDVDVRQLADLAVVRGENLIEVMRVLPVDAVDIGLDQITRLESARAHALGQ